MSNPNEYTDNFKSNLTCIFLFVRAKFKKKHFAPKHSVANYKCAQIKDLPWNLQPTFQVLSPVGQSQDSGECTLKWTPRNST